MTLRARLLVAFVAFALFTLLVFGVVAYEIATDNAARREVGILQKHVTDEVSTMAGQGGTVRWQAWTGATDATKSGYLVLAANDKGELQPANPSIDPEKHAPLIKQIQAGEKNGKLESGGQSLIWASAPVGSSPYTLVMLHPLSSEPAPPLKTLSVRLIAAGIIVTWIAVWGALILSGLFIKRQEKYNADLLHQALHDELTGLPKRNLLYDRLQQAIHQAQRGRRHAALLIMDLDRFKEINDTLGHHSGDELLKQVGGRLQQALRKSDTVARLGGDEFAILAPDSSAEQAVQLANKIAQIMSPTYLINGMEVSVQPSIGISTYPEHGENVDALIRHADVAMYQAKQQGGGFSVYASESDPHSLHRLALIGDLRHALENNGLTLYYQPELDLASGLVSGVEVLARWNHPHRGLIPPDEFVALAEKSGQIKALTELVLRKAFEQYHAWRRTGGRLKISINLSPRNLHDMGLPVYIGRLTEAWNVPPADIRLEITEGAMLADPAKARRILTEFDAMGLELAIDDFGTGYSSLSYLKQLPVSIIKIDKSFVLDMIRDEDNASIVHATIDLAHNLGLKVVAEGVENEETQLALQALGCDYLQGYHLSKPVPAEELIRWLARRDAVPGAAAATAL